MGYPQSIRYPMVRYAGEFKWNSIQSDLGKWRLALPLVRPVRMYDYLFWTRWWFRWHSRPLMEPIESASLFGDLKRGTIRMVWYLNASSRWQWWKWMWRAGYCASIRKEMRTNRFDGRSFPFHQHFRRSECKCLACLYPALLLSQSFLALPLLFHHRTH